MGDIKLFRTTTTGVSELKGTSVALEKSLQSLIEKNLDTFLGIRFLASEYNTGKDHAGRMDTLGIDENSCPVTIEYKRSTNENVINQGLFYLDWLMDHRKEFEWLVMEEYGREEAEKVEWSMPRLLCIAGDFTKYDGHAVRQMNRNVELIRYLRFGEDLLLFELADTVTAPAKPGASQASGSSAGSSSYKTFGEYLTDLDDTTRDTFEAVRDFLLGLGDDVQEKELRLYLAFKRIKNFACVEVRPQKKNVLIYVKVDPDSVELEDGFTRDVRAIGHFGTGDLELTLRSMDDLERAKALLLKSYESS